MHEVVNQLVVNYKSNDQKVSELFSQIESLTSTLDSQESLQKKFETVLSTEYILFRLRIIIERESLTIKQLLSLTDDSNLKAMLSRRDIYLSQASSKVTSLQNDISIIQKLQYSNSFNSFK